MAQVPQEAVEFSRMLVRSFHPDEFIVIFDAVLRYNNYCAHHFLARRLKIQPKELRQILVRMMRARLICNEKRQQKRFNIKDDRRGTRIVSTEFWYVPLPQVIDAFQYRIHELVTEIDARREKEDAAQKLVCSRCATEFEQLDIINNEMTPDGDWYCHKVGVRPDRRKLPCGGIIRPQDNSDQIKETERMRQKLDTELRVLRERAARCSRLDIPAHPLDGADAATWGEIVPETVGLHGEAVDEEGLTKELAERLKDPADKSNPPPENEHPIPISEPEQPGDIPVAPDWFQGNNPDEDVNWVDDTAAAQEMLNSKTGTAASFADESDYYLSQYLDDVTHAGPSLPRTQTTVPPPDSKLPEVIDLDADEPHPARQVVDLDTAGPAPPNATLSEPGQPPTATVKDIQDDVAVSVGGKQMMFSQVTDDMLEDMSTDEHRAYFAVRQGDADALAKSKADLGTGHNTIEEVDSGAGGDSSGVRGAGSGSGSSDREFTGDGDADVDGGGAQDDDEFE